MNARKREEYSFMPESNFEGRIVRLETVIENINSTLLRMDKRFDSLENKVDRKFELLENNMKEGFKLADNDMKLGFKSLDNDIKSGLKDVNNRLWSNFLWIFGSNITFIIAFIGFVGHSLHWF